MKDHIIVIGTTSGAKILLQHYEINVDSCRIMVTIRHAKSIKASLTTIDFTPISHLE